MGRGNPACDRVSRLLGDFELHRALRLLLHDDRAERYMTTLDHIVDSESNQIATAQLAVNGEVEQREFPRSMALSGAISVPAWKNKPSWYLIATDDKMIPPPAQQFMSKRAGSTVVEVKGSHSVYVSKPEEVAALIETAAKGVKVAAS
jgi:pimeloyl-ACP methyl ester carboxylesterase